MLMKLGMRIHKIVGSNISYFLSTDMSTESGLTRVTPQGAVSYVINWKCMSLYLLLNHALTDGGM